MSGFVLDCGVVVDGIVLVAPGVGLMPVGELVVELGTVPGCVVPALGIPEFGLVAVGRCGVAIEAGPMERFGAKGAGTSIYFRDPDGSLMEFISYRPRA